jgi:hypothetical protein
MRADMSRRRPLAVAATVAAAVLASVSCHSYQPLTYPSAAVGQSVKVQFAQPRDVTGQTASGPDSLFKGVHSLEGRVLAVSTDTLHVTVTKITDASGERAVTTSITAKIRQEPSVAVDVLSLDANRTAAVTGGTLYVGLTLLAVVAILALAGPIR